MIQEDNKYKKGISILHPRNKHQGQYDFKKLTKALPAFNDFIELNKYGNESINFSNPEAVKALNTAILKAFYNIKYWDFPKGHLCPPIPGRVDYMHYLADLLSETNKGIIPKGGKTRCLDIGTGANCIYPIVGTQEYGWSFVGSDIDIISIDSAKKIVSENPSLEKKIEIRLQENPKCLFQGILFC